MSKNKKKVEEKAEEKEEEKESTEFYHPSKSSEWIEAEANLITYKDSTHMNFQFLIDAFSNGEKKKKDRSCRRCDSGN